MIFTRQTRSKNHTKTKKWAQTIRDIKKGDINSHLTHPIGINQNTSIEDHDINNTSFQHSTPPSQLSNLFSESLDVCLITNITFQDREISTVGRSSQGVQLASTS